MSFQRGSEENPLGAILLHTLKSSVTTPSEFLLGSSRVSRSIQDNEKTGPWSILAVCKQLGHKASAHNNTADVYGETGANNDGRNLLDNMEQMHSSSTLLPVYTPAADEVPS